MHWRQCLCANIFRLMCTKLCVCGGCVLLEIFFVLFILGLFPHALVEMSALAPLFSFSKGKYAFTCVLVLKRVSGRGLKES